MFRVQYYATYRKLSVGMTVSRSALTKLLAESQDDRCIQYVNVSKTDYILHDKFDTRVAQVMH